MSSPAEGPACETSYSKDSSLTELVPAMNGIVTSPCSAEHASPGESSQHMPSVEHNKLTEVHVSFDPIYIHTAICDRCNKHNTAVIQRCDICSLQICKACMYSGSKNDGKHWLDEGSDNWRMKINSASAPRRSQRKPRVTAKAKVSLNSAAAGPGATRIAKQRPAPKSKPRTRPAASTLEKKADSTAQAPKEPGPENSLLVPEWQMEQDRSETEHDVHNPQLPSRRSSSSIQSGDVHSVEEADVASITMSHSSTTVDHHLDVRMDIRGAVIAPAEDKALAEQQQVTNSNLSIGQIGLLLDHFSSISANDISCASSDQTLARFIREQRFEEAQEMLFCSLHLLEMHRKPEH